MKKIIALILFSFMLGACSTTEYQKIDNSATELEERIGHIEDDLDKLNSDAGINETEDDNTPRKNTASKLYDKYINE